MNYAKAFRVAAATATRLSDIDPEAPKGETREAAEEETQRNLKRLGKSQYLLYADAARSLLVVLQGMDAAGKDGAIRSIFSGFDPQGTSVTSFKEPSHAELAHDFLWRVHAAAPAKGEIAIFNRSQYEDVLIARVRKLVPEAVWSARYAQINAFEALLAASGTQILKFYLHISPQEQLNRFKDRLDDPDRQWKISESDYTERAFWPEYIAAYEDVFAKTSTKTAPWYIIPANKKWYRNRVIAQITADTLERMDLVTPKPQVDIDAIRRQYHAEAAKNSKR
ncbi:MULTISPECIES: PPK2 family polyphosphate kinase [Rhodomicrobium]|uniref:PPK2 family polyphosphate kinase n=1 Tax=Rhodomicrobium TaxID=1068 RepID=UPI000B4AD24E|nr:MULTISPECIES: PPK2 family polyphosphate kinase [Rhodomicrobium]